MSTFDKQVAASKEQLRESIRENVKDAIDAHVNEKVSEKGYNDDESPANDEDGSKEKKKKSDEDGDEDDEESDDKLDEHALQLESEDPELYSQVLEFVALADTDSGEVSELNEASRRKAAAIGMVIGGGIPGAIVGASMAKGKQRTLQDQIDKTSRRVSEWKKDPKANMDKIKNAEEKMKDWQSQLNYLKRTGKGDAGMFRSSYKKAHGNR